MNNKKLNAQKWLETVDMDDVEPQFRPMVEYIKKLMSGKTPTEIKKERKWKSKDNHQYGII